MMFVAVANICAQVPAGRTNAVTIFEGYKPAIVTLTTGKISKVAQANIFMKNASLVYRSGTKDMEASMNVVKQVRFGDRMFIKVRNQLAEVLDTCGNNLLVSVRLIDLEAMKSEMYNNSDITNLSFSDAGIGVTRNDLGEDDLKYPVIDNYYYIIKDKPIPCHDREVRMAVNKALRHEMDIVIQSRNFSWGNRDDLREVLKAISKEE